MNPDSLWGKVFKSKYFPHTFLKDSHITQSASHIWRAIHFGSCNLFKNMYWVFGDGMNINMWHDIWFPKGPLRKLLEGPLQFGEENSNVATLRQSPNWKFDSLSMPILEQIKSIIPGILVPLFQNTQDKLV